MTSKTIKNVGTVLAVVSVGLQIFGSIIADKKLDLTIEEKVNEAISKK